MNLQMLAEKTKARYRPQDRKPEPDWIRKELSASKLVKESAEVYAQRLITQASEPFDPKWGLLGNSIADVAMVDWDAHEVELRVPIDAEWSIVGHPDGISVTDDGVVVGEHKYFLQQTDSKVENAGRQGTLYLGMAWQMAKAGKRETSSALYHHSREDFEWPVGAKPAGVVVACSPSHQSTELVNVVPLTVADVEACVSFYVRKGTAILESLAAGTVDAARAWDQSPEGSAEAGVRSPDLYAPIPAVEDVGAAATELVEVQRSLAQQEATEKVLKAKVKSALEAAGKTSYRWTDAVAFKIVTVKETEIAAKAAYVKRGYSFLQEA